MNKGWKPIQTEVLGAMDDRKVAALRLMLGVSAALIAYAGSYGPGRWSPVTYAVLAANALYDTIVYLVARRREIFPKPVIFLLISIDVAVYSLLVSLSTGTNSTFIFFFFYFFFNYSFN